MWGNRGSYHSYYTPSDALSPHAILADEAIPLPLDGDLVSATSEANDYFNGLSIISICQSHSVTHVYPCYGFLSENAEFARQVVDIGMRWLGLEVVPGSNGLATTMDDAMAVANEVGFPVILKPTSGGGCMGMVVCSNKSELNVNFQTTKDRAKVNIVRYLLSLPNIFPQILFGNDGVFMEK